MPPSNSNGRAKSNGHAPPAIKSDEPTVDRIIEQAEQLRASLRDSLSKTSQLVSALKHHRKQSKAVQNALVSLRRLQEVGV